MSEERVDPSQNTQAFQVWVDKEPAQPGPAGSRLPLVVACALGAVVVLAAAAWLLVG